MQKARSGLAAAAARWQLVDAPEGESSLESRLVEAERRAQDAEASAQDAQAALARTLLDAARVEAVVTARIQAKSEAEIEALRSELESLKHATATVETALQDGPREDSDREAVAPAAPADIEPVTTIDPDRPDRIEAPADGEAPATTAAERDAASGDVAEAEAAPALRISDDDRPEWTRPQEEPVAESNVLRFLPPARIAFLAVVGIVAVISYFVTAAIMDGRDRRTVVAGGAGTAAVVGTLQNTGTDPKSIAAAAAKLDAEMARLSAMSKKVESLRTVLAARGRASSAASTAAADRTPARTDANWLLYMPVERPALVEYLAGRSWPGMQTASRPQAQTAVQR